MPAPNDLTPEEEQAFIEHGVQPAGPGSEPVVENDGDIQNQGGNQPIEGDGQQPQPGQEPQPQPQPGQQPQPQPGQQPAEPEVSRHRPDGTFKTQAEYEADVAAAKEQAALATQQNQQQQQPQMVPHQALHAERQRAAAAIRQAQLATARMNALLMAQQGNQPQQQQMPDLTEDPVGYIQAMEQRLAEFERERQENAQFQQIDSALEQDEALFSAMMPDYQEASDHYVRSRAAELLAFHTPQDAQRIMMNEARQIAQQAWQRGQSAGQVVYQLAQARGYTPGQQQPQQQQPTPQPQPGQQPQAQQPQPQGNSARQQVAAIANAQQASRSLSGGGAQSSTAALNADALLSMSDEEFEQYLALGQKGANQRFAAIG